MLVTSVKTRALTLDEIRAKGIVLDSDDYSASSSRIGLKLESKAGRLQVPGGVRPRRGAGAAVHQAAAPAHSRKAPAAAPTIVPILFEVLGPGGEGGARAWPPPATAAERRRRDPHPERHRHPRQRRLPEAVLLGQALRGERRPRGFGARGAGRHRDARSCRRGRRRQGPSECPRGRAAATTRCRCRSSCATARPSPSPRRFPCARLGPDGEPGTADDVDALPPGEPGPGRVPDPGRAGGLPHGRLRHPRQPGRAAHRSRAGSRARPRAAVLVRNAYFDMSFTVPGVVRAGETVQALRHPHQPRASGTRNQRRALTLDGLGLGGREARRADE